MALLSTNSHGDTWVHRCKSKGKIPACRGVLAARAIAWIVGERLQSRPVMRKPVALGTCFAAAVASGSCSPPRDRTLALGTLLRVPGALYRRVTIHGLL